MDFTSLRSVRIRRSRGANWSRKPQFRPMRAVSAIAILMFGFTAWCPSANADSVKYSALDQIERNYPIAVTNPVDHVTQPALLAVNDAELTNVRPSGAGTTAPRGKIYLTFRATCGPEQLSYRSPGWGHFFSTMTPLPATALLYQTASGARYRATRVNAINQADNMDASSDDGLIDATYYFTVPTSERSGAIIIGPSQTMGMEYQGFVGQSLTPLTIGGPTTIPVDFPAHLTVAKIVAHRATSIDASTGANFLGVLSTIISLFLIASVYRAFRRRRLHTRDLDGVDKYEHAGHEAETDLTR